MLVRSQSTILAVSSLGEVLPLAYLPTDTKLGAAFSFSGNPEREEVRKTTEDRKIVTDLTVTGKQAFSKTKLRHIWHQLFPKKPLPKMSVLVVSKEELLKHIEQMKRHHEERGKPTYVQESIMKEWGMMVEPGASTTKTADGYCILIRSDQDSIENSLKHELRHIHDGDLERRDSGSK